MAASWPPEGGTTVSAHGLNINERTVQFCSFGGDIAVSHFVSEKEIKCVSPGSRISGDINVSLLDRYQRPIGFPVLFTYKDPFTVNTLHPSIVVDTASSIVTVTGADLTLH